MKQLSILVFSLLLLAGCQQGCGTGPQQAAYRAAGTTVVSVDVAMQEWGAYVRAYHPAVSQELAVKSAFEKCQASMAAVCDVGAVYAAAAQNGNASNLASASAALQQAVLTSGQSITDLENLITKFGVTLK